MRAGARATEYAFGAGGVANRQLSTGNRIEQAEYRGLSVSGHCHPSAGDFRPSANCRMSECSIPFHPQNQFQFVTRGHLKMDSDNALRAMIRAELPPEV